MSLYLVGVMSVGYVPIDRGTVVPGEIPLQVNLAGLL